MKYIVLCLAAVGVMAASKTEQRGRVETHDDRLIRVEKLAPGFGGMFVDPEGQLAVYLLDTTQLAATRSAIETVFGTDLPTSRMRAVQGQYVISQLKEWSERAIAVMRLPGVTIVDLDEAKNRVTIGVEEKSQIAAVEQRLSSLKIPREAVLFEVTDKIERVKPR
jgi:hypothetical protein